MHQHPDWLDTERAMSEDEAAVFAHGMRQIASADGHLNPRELAVIASFEACLSGEATQGRLPQHLVLPYVHALALVAVCDGRMGSSEQRMLHALAEEQGVSEDVLATCIEEAKHRFMEGFSGKSLFRASVLRVAEDLGVTGEALSALKAEA